MKKIGITLFMMLLVTVSKSQSIYHYTEILKKNSDLDGGKAEILVNEENYNEVFQILFHFLTIEQQKTVDGIDSISVKIDSLSSFYSKDNPFIKIPGSGESSFKIPNFHLKGLAKSIGIQVGAIPVTTFADGLAQFMIERANEEINVWFFRKFREDLNQSIELRTTFPLTNNFVQITEPYQYAQNLHLLREAFKRDLSEIIDNLEDLANLEKYHRIFEKSDELKIALVGLVGASIVSKIKNGKHPADVIDSLGQKQYLGNVNNNLFSSLMLFSTLSQSLRSTNESVAYITASEFNLNILSDDIGFRIYLGLLYQQLKDIGFSKEDPSKTIGQFLIKEKDKILQSRTIGLGLLERLNSLEDNFERIKIKSDTAEIKYLEWFNFYGSVIDLVEFGMEVPNILPIPKSETFFYKAEGAKKFIYSARLGNEIFRNVNEKNYSLAFLNFSVLYDDLIYLPIRNNHESINFFIEEEIGVSSNRTDAQKAHFILTAKDNRFSLDNLGTTLKKDGRDVKVNDILKEYYQTESIETAIKRFKKQSKDYTLPSSKFIKYGAFMAAVADAEKPEDVKAALNAAALPAGSSSIKRQTPFNVSINSYLGFHVGEEKLEGKGWGTIRGVSAPVGVAISTKLGRIKEYGSLSVFGSIIDIGAVASFRLTNDEGVETLPEMKLENIIAPGAYLVYGIPKAPISIGYGWQRGPQLRGITTLIPIEGESSIVTYELENGYRWTFFIAVDIPLFNLYTKSK